MLTINDDIANCISPVFFILCLAIIGTQLPSPMSENCITLSKNLSTGHLNDWNVARGIHLRNRTFSLVFWPFVESVSNILICSTSIL